MFDTAEQDFAKPQHFQNYIDCGFQNASTKGVIEREGTPNGKLVSIYPASTENDAQSALTAARTRFDDGTWAFTYTRERSHILRAVAQKICDNADELALIETLETTKPLSVSTVEVLYSANMRESAARSVGSLHGDSHKTLAADMMGVLLHEPSGDVGQTIVESDDVEMVAFTGSTRVEKIAIQASTGNIKKLLLELGGKPSSIAFVDFKMEAAVDGFLKPANVNTGKCCIAGSQVLLQDSIVTSFKSRLVEAQN